MLFDPKLIRPENAPLLPDGELDLPPELAALAEQLRDDSAHLATRYPAARNDLPAGKRSVAARRWIKIATLAASAAAALLVAAVVVEMFDVAARSPTVADRPANNTAKLAVPDRSLAAPAVPAVPPAAHGSATISLTELSGPELEALLDLWHREPRAAKSAGISF